MIVKKKMFIKNTPPPLHKILENNKLFYLGIATLCIILYHMPRAYPVLNVFNPGFIGVDFFLFFSGFSLCYSINKNKLGIFWWRRFLRIYPMYCVLAIASCVLTSLGGNDLSLFDWICNITTLSYYKIGGCFVDWYLSSIFLFYLLFPLLYRITTRIQFFVPISIAIVVGCLICFFDIDWWYGCAIGRLPIYSLGLFLFLDKSSNKIAFLICSMIYMVLFAVSVYLYKEGTFMRGYFITDMITPLLLLLIAYVIYKIPCFCLGKIGTSISEIGRFSLEIYVANVITMKTINNLLSGFHGIVIILSYFIINLILTLFLININSVIKKSTIDLIK